MPTCRITPLDRHIVDTLHRAGRIEHEVVVTLEQRDLPSSMAASTTLADLLVEAGYLDAQERAAISRRFQNPDAQVESSQRIVSSQSRRDLAATVMGSEEMDAQDAAALMGETIDEPHPDLEATYRLTDGERANVLPQPQTEAPSLVPPSPVDFSATARLSDEALRAIQTPQPFNAIDFESTHRMSDDEFRHMASPPRADSPISEINFPPVVTPLSQAAYRALGLHSPPPIPLDFDSKPNIAAETTRSGDEDFDLPSARSLDADDFPPAYTVGAELESNSGMSTAADMEGAFERWARDAAEKHGRTTVPPPLIEPGAAAAVTALSHPTPSAMATPAIEDTVPADSSEASGSVSDPLPLSLFPEAAPTGEHQSGVRQAFADPDLTQPSEAPDEQPGREGVSPEPFRGLAAEGSEAIGSVGELRSISAGLRSGHLDVERVLTAQELQGIEARRRTLGGSDGAMLGRVLGGYVVLDKLGEGGMGAVYLARQASLGRDVALKVLPERVANNPTLASQFVYEANLLARMSHPNIVQIYDVQAANDGRLYFTMEAIKGETLRQLIEQHGQVPIDLCLNIIRQCCRALGQIRSMGITHRDIKPGNILLDQQGTVKIVDFGLADFTQTLQSRAGGHLAGTPLYMPPESIQNLPATHLSDQYSLGATLYHMVTGKPPFLARDLAELAEKHLHEQPAPPSSLNTNVPRLLDKVILRMMAKEPGERYPSFRAVFEALEAVEMKLGLRTGHEQFLADQLIDLSRRNIRNLYQHIITWTGVTLVGTYAIMALYALSFQYLRHPDALYLADVAGNWGFYLITLAYFIILYIGAVRKKMLPAWGSIRTWLQVHIGLALAGSALVIYHSGLFLRDIVTLTSVDHLFTNPVALLPLANTVVLILVVISGLVGRYIYRDLTRQVQLERLNVGAREVDEHLSPHRMTMMVISHRVLGYWRVLHYPLTIVFFLLALLHVLTVMYYGGDFLSVHPDAMLIPTLR